MAVPLVEMTGIEKSFPGVHALVDARFELLPGEVHALVGENGAGKSTLMKVLAGVYTKDAGRILVRGRRSDIASPRAAQLLGICMIHQELNLMRPPHGGAEHLHRPRAAAPPGLSPRREGGEPAGAGAARPA